MSVIQKIKKKFLKNLFVILLPVIVYFFPAVATISDYNVNWDEPVHFVRGQAYLRFFLTGEKNYGELKDHNSLYQNKSFDTVHFLEHDEGHPPLNGILSALTNVIVYQKLGLLGDIESYHFFIIVLSSLVVFLVFQWARSEYGFFAGFTALLAIGFYPLFVSESHNNIKDPVETAFFTFAVFAYYMAIKKKSLRWIFFSSISSGLALGTKFNILFLPLILIPWLLLRNGLHIPRSIVVASLMYPIITILIFFATWPFLWQDPLANIAKILGYYKGIGFKDAQGFSTYAGEWIIFTTPLPMLFFLGVGIISAIIQTSREKDKTAFLWLLWFIIPIVRVSLPGAGIYGGVRQIMEFLPAAALLAGLGAHYVVTWLDAYIAKWFKSHAVIRLLQLCVILSFIPTLFKLVSIHPNQNLYFNELIGGLEGAVKRDFPGWGTTLGNPYLQGLHWLNLHAEKDAKLTLALGTMTNIPSVKLREDIRYDNSQESVVWREGEYIMGLTYYGFPLPYYDASYPERYLIPIHEVKVEGIPILRIWKNDLAHTKPGFVNEKELIPKTEQKEDGLFVDLEKEVFLTRIELTFGPNLCIGGNAFLHTSLDGVNWKREPEGLLDVQIPRIKKNTASGKILHLVAVQPARYLKIECYGSLKVFSLRDVFP